MTIESFFSLLPAIFSGWMLVQIIWPDKALKSILIKLFLGTGIGMGINSLFLFLYLLLFDHLESFIGVQIFVLIVLALIVFFRERHHRFTKIIIHPPDRLQIFFLSITGIMVILAAIIYATVSLRKPQGAWDSWMIYNRAARFFFRGGDQWAAAFSPELYWFFHADYPPLVALNVASGWEAIGQETIRVPMAVGGVFLVGSAGLLFAGLNAYKTLGQASLGLIMLFGTSSYIEVGSKQIADVPLSFFILATGILIFLYSIYLHKGLLVLAGLSAGLAAWTKNEGIVFMGISFLGLGIAYRKELKRAFLWYMLGLAIPLAILVYFKIELAPPGDLVVDLANQMLQIFDSARHFEIRKQLGLDLYSLVNWKLLVIYALVLGIDKSRVSFPFLLAGLIIILLQLMGYYFFLLISPHPVLWHLSALYRLLLQIAPLILFLYFSVVRTPESIFQRE